MNLFRRTFIKLAAVMLAIALPFTGTNDAHASETNNKAIDFICGIGLMYGNGSDDFIDDINLSYSEFAQIFKNLGRTVPVRNGEYPTAKDIAEEMVNMLGYNVLTGVSPGLSYFM